MPPEVVQWWRFMWLATMPDGRVLPQFNADGKKLEWRDLPAKPVKVALVPFSKELAIRVRSVSKIPALEVESKPVELEDFGEGIMAGQDQRTHLTPLVKCLICAHTWPFNPRNRAECPKCHVKDEFFCTRCQKNQAPLVLNNKFLCPECKVRGETHGLKRIMKFQISQSQLYQTYYWIRSPPVEMRVTDDGSIIVHPWRNELPEIPPKKPDTS